MQVEPMSVTEIDKTFKKVPKVSICVVTYNQKKYIRQCLQSLVDQEADFDYEIVVGDDCSKDGTREIVLDFARKYPNKFRLFLHEKNIGALPNFKFIHEQALGKYIAHMDGDDYAMPGKLQAQADILDQDKNCNLVWTPVLIEAAPGQLHEQNEFFKKNALKRRYTRGDLIKYGTIGTNSSKMYRKIIENESMPVPGFELIDYFVNVMQVGNGVARFTGDKPLGVYRLGIGIASNGSKTKNLTLQSIEYFAKLFEEYKIECSIAAGFHLLVDLKNKNQNFKKSLVVFLRTFHWRTVFCILIELRFMRNLTLKRKSLN